jgi:hypothetical protein
VYAGAAAFAAIVVTVSVVGVFAGPEAGFFFFGRPELFVPVDGFDGSVVVVALVDVVAGAVAGLEDDVSVVAAELVPVVAEVDVSAWLLAVVPAGAWAAAVWPDVVVCEEVDALLVWLDPPQAESPIAADTALTASSHLPATLARGANLVSSSERSIATEPLPRCLDHQGNSYCGQPFQTYPLLSTSTDRVYEMNTTK